MSYELQFFRRSQHDSYAMARHYGALRTINVVDLDGDELDSSPVNQHLRDICLGVETVDCGEEIHFFLLRDGKLLDFKMWTSEGKL